MKLSLNNYVRYLTSDILFDPARAKELLGWNPRENFNRSVEDMVRQLSRAMRMTAPAQFSCIKRSAKRKGYR